MTHTHYSKPSSDIDIEVYGWDQREKSLLESQRILSNYLHDGPLREACLLCDKPLDRSQAYRHRSVELRICANCGHLQTTRKLPSGYPQHLSSDGFEKIYPQLDNDSYLSRRDRIYTPKLDWILSRINALGISSDKALDSSWLELGCGAGYFLSSLQSKGARNIVGLDSNNLLVNEANRHCTSDVARFSPAMFEELKSSTADIINAFFVLEHIEEAHDFWQIMSNKPSGTIFAFAVPAFGLSTITEGAFDSFAARNLDNVVHTQLYTDNSIDYVLEYAGYSKIGEWLFGQDAQDLCRLLIQKLSPHMDNILLNETASKLSSIIDPFQQVLDHLRLCDARHVIALKD